LFCCSHLDSVVFGFGSWNGFCGVLVQGKAAGGRGVYQSHFLCKFLCVKCILLDLTFSLIFWFTFLHINEGKLCFARARGSPEKGRGPHTHTHTCTHRDTQIRGLSSLSPAAFPPCHLPHSTFSFLLAPLSQKKQEQKPKQQQRRDNYANSPEIVLHFPGPPTIHRPLSTHFSWQ